jgi:hypothetical protein
MTVTGFVVSGKYWWWRAGRERRMERGDEADDVVRLWEWAVGDVIGDG